MKAIALKIQSYFLALTGPLGGWALLLIALFDSSFLSLPEVNDILIITLSLKNPEKMLYYCTMTTLGSILGCLVLFTVGRKGGQVLLRKKFADEHILKVARWYAKYGVFAVMIPSILPPPTPFKIFVLFAGAFRISVGKFVFAITAGRGFRYFLEGFLAVKYGEQAKEYMHQNYPYIALGAVLVIGIGALAVFLYRRNRSAKPPPKRAQSAH
ncbi:MAG: VTT domain-containing protein [Acidobacteria bacterium]|nr:VTT domain-containing protein [Acidobacteriota bacterium]